MNNYYVYAYLRSKDSETAKSGTPYYIGKGKGRRVFSSRHNVSVPADRSKIVFLKEHLTDQEAINFEIEMILKYGRKDIGTGILYNRTNGGEGQSGRVVTDEQKLRHSLKMTGKPSKLKNTKLSDLHKQKISVALVGREGPNKGKTMSSESNAKRSESLKGRTQSAEWVKKRSEKRKGKPQPTDSCIHCGLVTSKTNIARWHNDKCKHKGSL